MAETASAAPAAGTTARGAPSGWLTLYFWLPERTRMTRTKAFAANAGSAEINAMVARTAPAVLELLGDGVPRSKAAIVEALAGRHDKQNVVHTLIRLSVTGQVVEAGSKYTLAVAEA